MMCTTIVLFSVWIGGTNSVERTSEFDVSPDTKNVGVESGGEFSISFLSGGKNYVNDSLLRDLRVES